MNDILTFTGIFIIILAGIYGFSKGTNTFLKTGSLLCGLTASVGLYFFGSQPFIIGPHHVSTYFGCTILLISILAWFLFMGISAELAKKDKNAASASRATKEK